MRVPYHIIQVTASPLISSYYNMVSRKLQIHEIHNRVTEKEWPPGDIAHNALLYMERHRKCLQSTITLLH